MHSIFRSAAFCRAFLFIFCCLSARFSAMAQNWLWARHADNITSSIPYDCRNYTGSDAAGNVYVAGIYKTSSLTLGSYTLTNYYPGAMHVYIAKYNPAGVLLWTRNLDSLTGNGVTAVHVDATGNMYIAGTFGDSINLGSTVLHAPTLYFGSPWPGMFLAKLDPSGNVTWAAGGGYSWITSIKTDASNNVYVAGTFTDSTMSIGTSTFVNAYPTRNDIFLAKYDASGALSWAKRDGGIAIDYVTGMALSPSGLHLVGSFSGLSTVFGGTTLMHTSYSESLFLANYDLSGNFISARKMSSAGNATPLWAGADNSGNIMLAGRFSGDSVTIDSLTLHNTAPAASNAFVAKINTSGDALWARIVGGVFNFEYFAATTDQFANLYISAAPTDSFVLGGTATTVHYGFLARYDPSGNAVLVQDRLACSAQYLSSDATGAIYLSGVYYAPPPAVVVFGPDTISGNLTTNMFLAKLANTIHVPNVVAENSHITVRPNPTNGHVVVDLNAQQFSNISVYDCLGRVVYNATLKGTEAYTAIDMGHLANGLYYVVAQSYGRMARVPVVVSR